MTPKGYQGRSGHHRLDRESKKEKVALGWTNRSMRSQEATDCIKGSRGRQAAIGWTNRNRGMQVAIGWTKGSRKNHAATR